MLKLLSCKWSQNLVLNKSARFIRWLFLLTFVCLTSVLVPFGRGVFNTIFTKFSEVENYSTDEKRDILITFDEKDQKKQDFLEEVNSDSTDEKRDILKTFDTKDQNNQGFPIDPFDLMNQIKKIGAMTDATTPSDALDEALNAFDESAY